MKCVLQHLSTILMMFMYRLWTVFTLMSARIIHKYTYFHYLRASASWLFFSDLEKRGVIDGCNEQRPLG